uniref:Uncharacterized protein n=1 Tax=Anguilla anguilla TaxID=7936 RepID=A0A0E9TCX0_ANGAN
MKCAQTNQNKTNDNRENK